MGARNYFQLLWQCKGVFNGVDSFGGENFSSTLRVAGRWGRLPTVTGQQGPVSSAGVNENEPSACL